MSQGGVAAAPAAPDPDAVTPRLRTSGAARLDCFQLIGFFDFA
jgi:hypothetical protein